MSANGRILYLVYNADGSVMGKIQYGYRKITCPKDGESVCAACDITHGGLSLKETQSWVKAKEQIRATSGIEIKQLHRDELSAEVRIPILTTFMFSAVIAETDGRCFSSAHSFRSRV